MTPVYHIQAIQLHCHSAVQQNAAGRTHLSNDPNALDDARSAPPALAAIAHDADLPALIDDEEPAGTVPGMGDEERPV